MADDGELGQIGTVGSTVGEAVMREIDSGAERTVRRDGRGAGAGARRRRRSRSMRLSWQKEMAAASRRSESGYPAREGHKGGKAMPRNNTPEIKRKKSGYDNKR